MPPSTFSSYIDVYWHDCTLSSYSTGGISVVLDKILSHEAVNWYKHKESIVSVTKCALTGGTCLIRYKLNVN